MVRGWGSCMEEPVSREGDPRQKKTCKGPLEPTEMEPTLLYVCREGFDGDSYQFRRLCEVGPTPSSPPLDPT